MIYIPFFIVILIDKRDDKRDDTKNEYRYDTPTAKEASSHRPEKKRYAAHTHTTTARQKEASGST